MKKNRTGILKGQNNFCAVIQTIKVKTLRSCRQTNNWHDSESQFTVQYYSNACHAKKSRKKNNYWKNERNKNGYIRLVNFCAEFSKHLPTKNVTR